MDRTTRRDNVVRARRRIFQQPVYCRGGEVGSIATSFDGTDWSTRTSSTTQPLNAIAASPGSVVAVGSNGTILQSPAAPAAPIPTLSTAAIVEAVGGNVALSVTTRGSTPLSFQWRKGGVDLRGETADVLFLPDVQIAHSGLYTCVVSNSVASVSSPPATLSVVPSLPPPDPVDRSFQLSLELTAPPLSVALQRDEKILIGGSFVFLNEGQPQSGLARLTRSGDLDPTFKSGTLNPGATVRTIIVAPNGDILIGGSFTSINRVPRNRLARLHANGSLDLSFVPAHDFSDDLTQLALAPNGRVFAIGRAQVVLCFDFSGALDPSWTFKRLILGTKRGAPVVATIDAIDVQPDGKLVVGCFGYLGDFATDSFLHRLNIDGTIDRSFSSFSFLSGALGFRALRLLDNGRIMAATEMGDIVRVQSSGERDLTFSAPVVSLVGGKAAFTADGHTWLAGSFTGINEVPRNRIARLIPNGDVDPTFSPGSGLSADGSSSVASSAIVPLPDGGALIAGAFAAINDVPRPNLARLNPESPDARNSPAILDVGPRYRELSVNEPFSVPVRASGSAPLTYNYSVTNAGGSVRQTPLSLTTGSAPASGPWVFTVTNTVGTSAQLSIFVRVIQAAPFIIQQPVGVQTNTGRLVTLAVDTGGSSSTTFQWFKNGTAIPGATRSFYTLISARPDDTGDYTVIIRNSLGVVTSEPAHVGVDETPRFINLATRGPVGKIDAPLIVGFVIQGPGQKRVMLRAAGPTLSQFNVVGVLADPILRVFNGAGVQIYANDDWSSSNNVPSVATAESRLGAFPLPTGSVDAAGILDLNPGSYTAVVSGKANAAGETTGIALAEIYEDDTTASSRFVNLSSRGVVGPGAGLMIPAFVTSNAPGSSTQKKYLIRAVAPTLSDFGVTNILANPTLTVTNSAGVTVATNDDWETNANLDALRSVTARLAFPLPAGSKDAALLISLPPGGHTIQVTGVGNTTGTALVEVYEVP